MAMWLEEQTFVNIFSRHQIFGGVSSSSGKRGQLKRGSNGRCRESSPAEYLKESQTANVWSVTIIFFSILCFLLKNNGAPRGNS